MRTAAQAPIHGMMLWIILTNCETCRSFMRLTQQTQFLANCGGGISNLVDRALQLVPGDAEVPGPVLHFVRLAHGNMAAVALALIEKIVAHLFSSCVTRKTPPGDEARPFAALPHLRFGKTSFLRCLSSGS